MGFNKSFQVPILTCVLLWELYNCVNRAGGNCKFAG
jgi:hypothetical protein